MQAAYLLTEDTNGDRFLYSRNGIEQSFLVSFKIKIKKELGVGKAGVLRSEAVLRIYDRDAIGLSGITV